jgi:hypothetical protein
MKRYIAVAPVTLHTGYLEISPEQAAGRGYCLEAVKNAKGSLFAIKGPVQFKVGEVFGYDGDATKAMRHQVEETDTHIGTAPKAALARRAAKGKKESSKEA